MAYKFGQLTKKTLVDYEPRTLECRYDNRTNHKNPIIILTSRLFQPGYDYRLLLNIEEGSSEDTQRIVNIIFHNADGPIIETVSFDSKLVHQIIFSPPFSSNQIILQDLSWIKKDSGDGWLQQGHFNCSVQFLPNLISSSFSSKQEWLKIGYHGRPGQKIVINHSPIEIGRSQMYELSNNIKIRNFAIVPNTYTQQIDSFILDYMYKEE